MTDEPYAGSGGRKIGISFAFAAKVLGLLCLAAAGAPLGELRVAAA